MIDAVTMEKPILKSPVVNDGFVDPSLNFIGIMTTILPTNKIKVCVKKMALDGNFSLCITK